jgi:hypothetical protein
VAKFDLRTLADTVRKRSSSRTQGEYRAVLDAMIAEVVSHLSGLKLLVLDRFDVLDIQGRADLIAWLDILAANAEIDTALIFGTLKALPADLPATMGAYWIEGGIVGKLKAAA